MPQRHRFLTLLAAMIVVGGGSAAAHYTYVMPEAFRVTAGDAVVVGFHSGDGFPDSSAVLKRLESPAMTSEGVRSAIEGVREDGKRLVATVRVPSGSHLIVTAVNGLDPVSWTSSKRRIRCPECSRAARSGGHAGSFLTSS